MAVRFALVVVVGCAQVPSAAPVATQPPVKKQVGPAAFAIPGEELEFSVQLRGITLGRMRTAIGEPGVVAGRRAIIMRSRGDAAGVLAMFGKLAYELTSTIDLERGALLRAREESWLEIAGREEHHHDDMAPDSDWDLPNDPHTAMARLRAWQLQPGEEEWVSLRVADASFTLKLRHAGVEYMPFAKAPAIRYAGQVDGEGLLFPFAIWISDDPSRVPLKLVTGSVWGTVSAELVSHDQLPSL